MSLPEMAYGFDTPLTPEDIEDFVSSRSRRNDRDAERLDLGGFFDAQEEAILNSALSGRETGPLPYRSQHDGVRSNDDVGDYSDAAIFRFAMR